MNLQRLVDRVHNLEHARIAYEAFTGDMYHFGLLTNEEKEYWLNTYNKCIQHFQKCCRSNPTATKK